MNNLQKWCSDNLPVIEAAARGYAIQIRPRGCEDWGDMRDACFRGDLAYEYRIKPRAIKIGDFDVPEPMREIPNYGDVVFTVEIDEKRLFGQTTWNGLEFVSTMLKNGLLHKSKDAAIAHAKAIIALTSAK